MIELEKSKFLQKLDQGNWLLPPVSFCANPNAIEKNSSRKADLALFHGRVLKGDVIKMTGVAVYLAAHTG